MGVCVGVLFANRIMFNCLNSNLYCDTIVALFLFHSAPNVPGNGLEYSVNEKFD